jgi:transcriptional regulator with XRE-family HTH domain
MAKKDSGAILAKRIRQLRKSRGLLQRELAEKLHCNRRAISYYETKGREPDANTIVAIADFFNVSLDFLYGRTDLHYPYDLTPYKQIKELIGGTSGPFTLKIAED